jgi:hypothetical protein
MSKYINCHLNPSNIKEVPWLTEDNEKISVKYMDLDCVGKWMLFYLKEDLDDAWKLAKKLYNEEELDGVIMLKVSTDHDNINKSSYIETGVILFICNESYDEDHILKIGKNIISKMKYVPIDSSFVYYKTNEQTNVGNRVTGEKKNYFYKIEV